MRIAAIFGIIMAALASGCAARSGDSFVRTTQAVNTINMEQMVESVPLVFYDGSAGAGVLFRDGKKIGCLTAAHVVADTNPLEPDSKDITYGTKIIHITGYAAGTESLRYTTTAKMVALSPEEDWAVLEVQTEASEMQFSEFADRLPQIGETAWCVGSPLFNPGTLSKGIVCHPHRSLFLDDGGMHYIHTDATGTIGSSGGGLFDENGVCIGIIVRKHPLNGTMYAIPTRRIHESLSQMFLRPDPFPPFKE